MPVFRLLKRPARFLGNHQKFYGPESGPLLEENNISKKLNPLIAEHSFAEGGFQFSENLLDLHFVGHGWV